MSRCVANALFATLALCASVVAHAASDDRPILVTPDNFVRAESDLYFSSVVKDGGFGKFMHRREPTPIAQQTVIRMNRDTLYSAAVFDLDAGPVTIALPDAGKRFLSMQVIDEDEYTHEVHYGAAVRTLTSDQIGTRYVIVAIRILFDPNDPKDVEAVQALQDALNNLIAKPAEDGSFVIQFGGCDPAISNCLPTPPGWNYLVRLYRPKPEILNGLWTFPEPQAAR
jgi:hypothetical protein